MKKKKKKKGRGPAHLPVLRRRCGRCEGWYLHPMLTSELDNSNSEFHVSHDK